MADGAIDLLRLDIHGRSGLGLDIRMEPDEVRKKRSLVVRILIVLIVVAILAILIIATGSGGT